jgi:hypothetical protein
LTLHFILKHLELRKKAEEEENTSLQLSLMISFLKSVFNKEIKQKVQIKIISVLIHVENILVCSLLDRHFALSKKDAII